MNGWMIGLIVYAALNAAMIIYMYVRLKKSDEWFDWFWLPVIHKDIKWYIMPRWLQIVSDIVTLILFLPAIIFHFLVMVLFLGIIFIILSITNNKGDGHDND